jgi:hypothetical protein
MTSSEHTQDNDGRRRGRLVAFVLGIFVLITGFLSVLAAARPSMPGSSLAAKASPDALVVHLPPPLPGGPNWPSPASISFHGEQSGMGIYGKGGRWDTSSPPQAWPQIGVAFPSAVPPGAELDIVGGAKTAKASVTRVSGSSTRPIELTDGVGRLPMRPGSYTLTVVGYWSEGSATLAVEITVGGS